MIRNLSYKDRELNEQITEMVGKPYGIRSIYKMKGIGSPRLKVLEASPDLSKYMSKIENGEFFNFELRPKGVIIRFRYHLDNMGWIIPYYKLSIFKSDEHYSVHSDGLSLKFTGAYSDSRIHGFVSKLLNQKSSLSL